MIKKYKKDILLIVLLMIIAGIILIISKFIIKSGDTVVIKVNGKEIESYSIEENITKNLDTGNTLVIQDKNVYVQDSTCRDKICINQGKISSVGESIICLPHKLVIEIEGDYSHEE